MKRIKLQHIFIFEEKEYIYFENKEEDRIIKIFFKKGEYNLLYNLICNVLNLKFGFKFNYICHVIIFRNFGLKNYKNRKKINPFKSTK